MSYLGLVFYPLYYAVYDIYTSIRESERLHCVRVDKHQRLLILQILGGVVSSTLRALGQLRRWTVAGLVLQRGRASEARRGCRRRTAAANALLLGCMHAIAPRTNARFRSNMFGGRVAGL